MVIKNNETFLTKEDFTYSIIDMDESVASIQILWEAEGYSLKLMNNLDLHINPNGKINSGKALHDEIMHVCPVGQFQQLTDRVYRAAFTDMTEIAVMHSEHKQKIANEIKSDLCPEELRLSPELTEMQKAMM